MLRVQLCYFLASVASDLFGFLRKYPFKRGLHRLPYKPIFKIFKHMRTALIFFQGLTKVYTAMYRVMTSYESPDPKSALDPEAIEVAFRGGMEDSRSSESDEDEINTSSDSDEER